MIAKLIQEGPIWRRTLASALAMIAASTAFVALVLVLLGIVVDRAVASDSLDKADKADKADTATSASDSKDSLGKAKVLSKGETGDKS